jgi:hypothetical protein
MECPASELTDFHGKYAQQRTSQTMGMMETPIVSSGQASTLRMGSLVVMRLGYEIADRFLWK